MAKFQSLSLADSYYAKYQDKAPDSPRHKVNVFERLLEDTERRRRCRIDTYKSPKIFLARASLKENNRARYYAKSSKDRPQVKDSTAPSQFLIETEVQSNGSSAENSIINAKREAFNVPTKKIKAITDRVYIPMFRYFQGCKLENKTRKKLRKSKTKPVLFPISDPLISNEEVPIYQEIIKSRISVLKNSKNPRKKIICK